MITAPIKATACGQLCFLVNLCCQRRYIHFECLHPANQARQQVKMRALWLFWRFCDNNRCDCAVAEAETKLKQHPRTHNDQLQATCTACQAQAGGYGARRRGSRPAVVSKVLAASRGCAGPAFHGTNSAAGVAKLTPQAKIAQREQCSPSSSCAAELRKSRPQTCGPVRPVAGGRGSRGVSKGILHIQSCPSAIVPLRHLHTASAAGLDVS